MVKPFFYIHIPKNAGVSMQTMLKPYIKDFQHPKHTKIKLGDSLWFGHNDPEETLKYVSLEHYKQAYKVCFLRDPRSRLVSLYYHLKMNKKYSFSEFVHRVTRSPLEPIGLYANRGLSICNPQARWLDNIQMNFIGRFENLEHDWSFLCSELVIPYKPLPHLNKRDSKVNWKNYYWDSPDLLEKINKFYVEDLEIGKYARQIRTY